jgi:RND family efflux transporter MFP subunit
VARESIARFIKVTGTLNADEQAEVSAETTGRVVETPVERGSRVTKGSVLVRLSAEETEAQVREAEANAAQIEAKLALGPGGAFDVNRVPEVANARATLELAQAEFERIRTLLDQKVVSQSEYDQRRTQVEAARQQYESAKNAAAQQYQSLLAARARTTMARKSLSDTVVRAPLAGLVGERQVSIGDFVTRGTKVATVVKIDPLRLQLTVPEQFVSQIAAGQPVKLTVDAYADRTFEGRVRFVSPAVRTDQRALTVEAVVPNSSGALKPGLFASAEIEQPVRQPALLVPAEAVQTAAGTSRVFLVRGDHVEERIVTIGQKLGDRIEIVNGLAADDVVASGNVFQLLDGARVQVNSEKN